ncbi:MAG: SIMPL domain-containing protein [Betaproteobacteria bacterium]
MNRTSRTASTVATILLFASPAAPSLAQAPQMPMVPISSVAVTATATTTVSNDRLQAWLRTEAESANAAAAAAQVNTASARALADAKTYPSIQVATMGYSTQQISERGKPTRWRVSQTITVDASDFTAAATLLSKFQDDNGLLLSNMSFSITDKTRRDAEDRVTQQAIQAWQARAQQAAQALGFAKWRVGRVSVQTSGGQAMPMMRAQAMTAMAAPPVALEAGTTDISVTVSGDAVLDAPR